MEDQSQLPTPPLVAGPSELLNLLFWKGHYNPKAHNDIMFVLKTCRGLRENQEVRGGETLEEIPQSDFEFLIWYLKDILKETAGPRVREALKSSIEYAEDVAAQEFPVTFKRES